ncbi:hypothetical protein VNO80_27573 [Phaseolus coccineus]|uniref:Uncharacterized protein n=1 Tax=Phaseolus coccineus TaxID=3886 RepID=A0AAN9QI46_PHACN
MSIFWLVFHVIDMCFKCFATSDNLSGANFKIDVDIYGVELFSFLCPRVGLTDRILIGGVGWWRYVLTVDT